MSGYDIILGMDWLSEFSPMWIDWRKKIIRFRYGMKRITLKGIKDNMKQCDQISAVELQQQIKQRAVAQLVQLCPVAGTESSTLLPPEIEQVLEKHKVCFQEPKGLPPQRAFDHKIVLIPGAQPVNLKSYRYTPQQKDEIERQIKEMLAQGIIKVSHSPFASPVLLVKKKDGTWRLCVDYRHLNAITVKDRFPMPVVEELLDELARATHFTKLDLRSGYHQIRMAPEDEYKTAFRTHHGHFEFKVVPFGL